MKSKDERKAGEGRERERGIEGRRGGCSEFPFHAIKQLIFA